MLRALICGNRRLYGPEHVAIGVAVLALMWRRKLGEDLTVILDEPISRPKRRGPQPELSDPQLHTRREQLVQAFEAAWGEIGGKLRRCKKATDLILIFSPLAESFIRDFVGVVCRASSEPVSAANLRKVRAGTRALVEPVRNADESRLQAQERLLRADWALEQAPKSKLRMLKRERKKRRKEAWKTLVEYRTLSDAVRRFEARLRDLEASFARQEAFRFLKSKRYELTPLALANAAAGLPYMGWRHSMRKNTEVQSTAANGFAYQSFKAIRYLAAIADKATEKAFVAAFRKNIPSLPSRYHTPRNELVQNWLFLERAVQQAYRIYRKEHNPRDLPFEVTKRYFMQIKSQSQVDRVLADQARLVLASEAKKNKKKMN